MASTSASDKKDQIGEVSTPVQTVSSKDEEDVVRGGPVPAVDYAGSSEKTDPLEIKLVRKLDMWMIVCTRSVSWAAEEARLILDLSLSNISP